jgi:hypothetical protein
VGMCRLSHNPIDAIVRRFGGQTEMARAVGCAQSTVWNWIRRGHVPSDRIIDIIEIGKTLDPPVHLEPNDFFADCGGEERS